MDQVKITVDLDEIYDAMRECFRRAITTGRNWHAVTVASDGEPYVREEVNYCVSESEYFGNGKPYPVTVWSMNGDSSVPKEEIDFAVDEFDPAAEFEGFGGVEELIEKLSEAGFEVTWKS